MGQIEQIVIKSSEEVAKDLAKLWNRLYRFTKIYLTVNIKQFEFPEFHKAATGSLCHRGAVK